jgi:hypothetical protein
MIDGAGRPGPDAFGPRMPGLYATAYSLRFALKRRDVEEKVGPLEGLWWTIDGPPDLDRIFSDDSGEESRRDWRWTLFIGLPDAATRAELDAAVASGREKLDPSLAATLRIGVVDEGRAAQLLHIGPYAAERSSIERLHRAISDAGLELRGRHHEIYLGNPRTSAPERLRTILRQPVS